MGGVGCYRFAFESSKSLQYHPHTLNLEDVLKLYSNSLSLGCSLSRRCTQQLTTNSLSLGREELTVGEAFCQRRRPSLWKTIIGELPNYIQHHLLPHVFVFVFVIKYSTTCPTWPRRQSQALIGRNIFQSTVQQPSKALTKWKKEWVAGEQSRGLIQLSDRSSLELPTYKDPHQVEDTTPLYLSRSKFVFVFDLYIIQPYRKPECYVYLVAFHRHTLVFHQIQ